MGAKVMRANSQFMGAKSCAQIRGCQSRDAAAARKRGLLTINSERRPRRGGGARSALAGERGAAAAHRRHDELVAAAGARVDVGAGAEAKVLAEANAHLAQAPAATGHPDGAAGEARIGLTERRPA